MSVRDSNTEKLIKDTAIRIFFKEGRFQATTQDIANAAGVNRTLVHYYFRSRELLFKQVLEEGQCAFADRMSDLIQPGLSFKEKVSHFIDLWLERGAEYPFLDAYMVSQMNNPELVQELAKEPGRNMDKFMEFMKDIEDEMNAGRIEKMNPIHFLINLVALVNYPILTRSLMEASLKITKTDYDVIMNERKEVILKTLFKV